MDAMWKEVYAQNSSVQTLLKKMIVKEVIQNQTYVLGLLKVNAIQSQKLQYALTWAVINHFVNPLLDVNMKVPHADIVHAKTRNKSLHVPLLRLEKVNSLYAHGVVVHALMQLTLQNSPKLIASLNQVTIIDGLLKVNVKNVQILYPRVFQEVIF